MKRSRAGKNEEWKEREESLGWNEVMESELSRGLIVRASKDCSCPNCLLSLVLDFHGAGKKKKGTACGGCKRSLRTILYSLNFAKKDAGAYFLAYKAA